MDLMGDKTMTCARCFKELEDGSAFCRFCGAAVGRGAAGRQRLTRIPEDGRFGGVCAGLCRVLRCRRHPHPAGVGDPVDRPWAAAGWRRSSTRSAGSCCRSRRPDERQCRTADHGSRDRSRIVRSPASAVGWPSISAWTPPSSAIVSVVLAIYPGRVHRRRRSPI